MVNALDVAFIDTRPDDLVWALGLPAQPALAVLDIERHGFSVQLRLLGFSHQVLVDDGRDRISETVACLEGQKHLPASAHDPRYRFTSRCQDLGADFEFDVQCLADELSASPDALAGVFPGHHLAMTGIQITSLSETQVTWQTWHAYPQVTALVTTHSTYQRAS